MSWPAYLDTYRSGALAERIEQGRRVLKRCTVCPRDCQIDRMADERKLCHTGRKARVSTYFAHFGEEDCLRGWNGSGTIFLSWCNLKCVFCQNWETSNEGQGEEVDAEQLATMMLQLQAQGCHNINFVTPEHVVPQVLEALPHAIEGGLRIPIVYNTSAYDSLHSLRLMDGIVDVYLPDFKYWDPHRAARYLKAKDYPAVARAAIAEMHRQVGLLQLDDEGLARRGVLIRHLVMPDGRPDTAAIMGWLGQALGPGTHVNVMDQYHPDGRVLREPGRYPALERPLTASEHREALTLARDAGLTVDERNPHPRLRRSLRIVF